jgi:hypothetical protein
MMQRWLPWLLMAVLVLSGTRASVAATSKQYVNEESAITFADSAQTPSYTFTLSALAGGAGRISARGDRGASAHAQDYKWRCTVQLTGTNVVSTTIEWYLSSSDGTNPDGQIGTADAALTTDKRNNLIPLGVTVVDQTTTNTNITASGSVRVSDRYVSFGVWNATALPFKTDTAVHGCKLTPIPAEMQ